MMAIFEPLLEQLGTDPGMLMAYLAALGIVCIVMGGAGFLISRDRTENRMRALGGIAPDAGAATLAKAHDTAPTGWKKALVPAESDKRAQVRFQLSKIGIRRDDAVELFFVVRLGLALCVPVVIALLLGLNHAGLLPAGLAAKVQNTASLRLLQIGAIGAAAGFYGPGYWLTSRIKARQQAIRSGFPNTLDLLQIAVESGLGFDAALHKVGEVLGPVAPEIAEEFHLLRQEIQAGSDREKALFAMADRMGIEEAKSFALVIAQSMQFGTSLTMALKTYAAEMRTNRELKAQEKANKLPVQMSGVMSFLMLPALFLITLTPVILRYMAMY